jgi:hypothetical protein
MASRPENIIGIFHTYWGKGRYFLCPICNHHLEHAFNDGGRKVETLKGILWVITNYYRCLNPKCELNDAFPAVFPAVLNRRQHGLDVWAKIIQHHFKHHLNYALISEMMWDDWQVSVSESQVRIVSEYFEAAGTLYLNQRVQDDIKSNGYMIISLDGAQPVRGEPSLWNFSDTLSGHTLTNRLLENASGEKLVVILQELEKQLGVPIAGMISDKQGNIVKARELFRPFLPHAYCQFHFLDHIDAPIVAKDSHLHMILRETVRNFAIVKNNRFQLSNNKKKSETFLSVSDKFAPICEELLCAIATKGNHFDHNPGVEAYYNLEYINNRLQPYLQQNLSDRDLFSVKTLIKALSSLLEETNQICSEIIELDSDFRYLRWILNHRSYSGKIIAQEVSGWIEMLQERINQQNKESRPEKLKCLIPNYKTTLIEAWQEWTRLEWSYHEGLYVPYDYPEIPFTNNEKEQLFHHSKAHFRSLLGRQDMADAFQRHAGPYTQLLELDFTESQISQVLLANEEALILGQSERLHAQYLVIERQWRIREIDTGNWKKFDENLAQIDN